MLHCYVVSQKIEELEEKEKEQNLKQKKKEETIDVVKTSECMNVSETLGGALCLIGGMISDLEHDESSFRCVDIQIGSGYFASDGKSYVLKLVSEVSDKNLRLTHGIWPSIISS